MSVQQFKMSIAKRILFATPTEIRFNRTPLKVSLKIPYSGLFVPFFGHLLLEDAMRVT